MKPHNVIQKLKQEICDLINEVHFSFPCSYLNTKRYFRLFLKLKEIQTYRHPCLQSKPRIRDTRFENYRLWRLYGLVS